MAKFKVGDRVRVLDGSKIEGYDGSWVPDMKEYVGNVYTIARMHLSGSYCLKGIPFIYDERGLERAGNPGKADKSQVARYAYGASLGYGKGKLEHPGTFRVLHIADDRAFIQRTDSYSTSCYLVGLDGLERVGGGKK